MTRHNATTPRRVYRPHAERWTKHGVHQERRVAMRFFLLMVSVGLSFILSARCSNPINAKTSMRYAQAANRASNSGDWGTARMYWSRAIVNAELGKASAAQLAVFNYEYGRASGVVCEFADAEKALTAAYEIDKQAGGLTYLSLVELSRLNLDQKKYPEAASYFERALSELEAKGALTQAPIEYAYILNESPDPFVLTLT